MLTILSPAKTMRDFHISKKGSEPIFHEKAHKIASLLESKSEASLQKLLKVSDVLAKENYGRFKNFKNLSDHQKTPAILAYFGDAFKTLAAETYNEDDLSFAQEHLFILSGMYGILRSLDYIAPYRLEISTSLKVQRSKNLYDYWRQPINEYLNNMLDDSQHDCILNLASSEYSKVIDLKKLKKKMITFHFREWKNGQLKTLSYSAKQSRGAMARYVIINKIVDVNILKSVEILGHTFSAEHSKENDWYFIK